MFFFQNASNSILEKNNANKNKLRTSSEERNYADRSVVRVCHREVLGDDQMDMSRVLVIAPLVVFALFFLTILMLRSFFSMRDKRRRARRGCPQSSIANNDTEISCNNFNSNSSFNRNNNSNNTSNPSPPSYYAEVMATNSSALYPVYVPPYAAPLMSLRDPRQFQGLPGLAAPPPYPPPPSYHQISSFPELPSAPHAVIDVAQQPRITKTRLEVTPVE
ncbi:uncharacterized protein CELE_F20G2.6 [Caenorhabditis elegans]|uniref:Transmembrane protein n=1 Tax=Caenorhabditis elegans TaxID=6239 RepID=Q52GY4_CAEEL|nr:Transmembrane protein [Caenorhabditis elegans]CAI91165.1 Transmembrane protein [Caenorhabditis elegans]|eukprot:NP_001023827.1 Uncharacterized protein CELE_F20G2.6 [Caenorhabditis elegans]